MELKTPQEAFAELYHLQRGKTDELRYLAAVFAFRRMYRLKEPYNTYNSFKSSVSVGRKKFKIVKQENE